MLDLLVKNPKTNFNESVPGAKTFLDDKELTTAEEKKFAFDQASLKVGSQVGTNNETSTTKECNSTPPIC